MRSMNLYAMFVKKSGRSFERFSRISPQKYSRIFPRRKSQKSSRNLFPSFSTYIAYRLIAFPCAFVSLSFGVLHASDSNFLHRYVESCEFEGDEDLDFVGDLVAILEDTSRWKIHPNYVDQFASWQLGDTVHIGRRTDWYWFKREHKFLLVNHDRNESIPVMLVWVGDAPLNITSVTESNATSPFTTLTLSDDSEWEMENRASELFSKEAHIYIGYNCDADQNHFFVISGIEKNATSCSVEMRNKIFVLEK
jgi:hypothetical protein